MTTSRNPLICLVICTAAGATACATAESNQAGDAGVLTDNDDASRAGFDAAPGGGDASPPSADAGGSDATTNPVCSTGNQPCATGCCPIAAPDELAPWTTGTIVATGTCRSTEVMPYSCYPSTPGRDANGCCVASIDGGTAISELVFTITTLPDGRHELLASACGLTNAVCAISASATQTTIGYLLRDPAAALKSTNWFPYVGPLSTSLPNGRLAIGFAGVADDLGNERCGHTVRYKSCTWTAP